MDSWIDRRGVLAGVAATAALPSSAGAQPTAIPPHDAVLGAGGLNVAIAAAPGNREWRILVPPGRWREKVVVDKPNVTLVGQDRATSILTYDDHSGTHGADGRNIGTSGSYSIAVRAPNFSARNLTIENAFDYDAAARGIGMGDQQATGGLQAVALMLGEGADRSLFEDCTITGHQDTLFANRGLALFNRCTISGTVDFIFGAGRVLLNDCEIVSRLRPDTVGRSGWVAAASTQRSQAYGLVFNRCRLTREAGVADRSVGLGRFWRPTTTFPDGRYGDPNAVGAAAFIRCWLGAHIIAEGWDPMGYNAQDGNRAQLTPHEARPSEYGSRGPGAAGREFQISATQAHLYAPERVLDGWMPTRL